MQKALIGGGVGLGIGLLVGQLFPPEVPLATRIVTRPGETRTRVVHAASGAPECSDPVSQEELEGLRDLTGLLEKQVEELELELYGEPQSWGDGVPEAYTPEAFTRNLEAFFEECDIPVDITGIRCEEPPCYALLRRDELNYSRDDPWAQALADCAPWQETYGPDLSLATHTITCDSGAQEGFTMLAPSPDWMFDWEEEPEQAKAQMQRFNARLREARESWACLDGGE